MNKELEDSDTDVSKDHGSRRSRLISYLLDDAFPVPGTQRRFGLDVVLGVIPGYGDAASTAIGSAIVVQAARAGVPWRIILVMACNQLVNGVIGTVPGVGDIFSAFFKSNARNFRLLEQWEGAQARSAGGRIVVWLVVVVLISATLLSVIAVWLAIRFVALPIGERVSGIWNGSLP